MMNLARYRKAILAALAAGLTAMAATLPDGLTLTEGMGAWVAGLLSGLGVYATPNAPPAPASWVDRRKATDERIRP